MDRKAYKNLSAAERYVVMALAADDFITDYAIVFFYFGPARLRGHAKAWSKKGLKAIIHELQDIRENGLSDIEDDPPVFRRTYLSLEIQSLISLLEVYKIKPLGGKLAGAVHKVLGIVPPPPYDLAVIREEEAKTFHQYGYADYADFEKLNRKIASPKVTGPFLRKWIAKLTDSFVRDFIPHMFKGRELAKVIPFSKMRVARALTGYPPDYFIYRGRWRGTMCMGEAFRKTGLLAVRTIMHELCPGHHMYYLYRELLYKLGLLGPEATVDLLYSTTTPHAEGVAETALYYITSLKDDIVQRAKAASARDHFCKKVLYNIWHHRFVTGRMQKDEAREYLIQEGGFEREKAADWLSFIDDWRVYYPAYPVGTDMIKARFTTEAASDIKYLYLPMSLPVLGEQGKQQPRNSLRNFNFVTHEAAGV